MVVKDEWVQSAIDDDNVVVEFLVRLKQAQAAPSPPKSALKWGIRQRRSRPMLLRCDVKRDGDFNVGARGSPTTPLCWSGGSSDASPSAVDGFEETSTHILRSPSRSKGSATTETNTISSKRAGRKKTFAELKEEEDLLMKERVHLEKEIASTRVTCKEHQGTNDNLKRIRLDLNSSLIDDEPEKVPSSWGSNLPLEAGVCSDKSIFVLPDLNMMPGEDECYST
ncbi:hypothetical protein V6N13_113404 [Hibiscus sabdariffa]|uniref:Uncharacterized protein n=1 Tax=Hibiscus sabdariffa TaxID=183260 RepID=A0ABR2CUJ5_9ROSI